jgi:manganese/zinc/iron transport system permease protein
VEQASIAPDHVHRDADDIEHVLTPEIIRQLEARLEPSGSLSTVPASVHEVREEA